MRSLGDLEQITLASFKKRDEIAVTSFVQFYHCHSFFLSAHVTLTEQSR